MLDRGLSWTNQSIIDKACRRPGPVRTIRNSVSLFSSIYRYLLQYVHSKQQPFLVNSTSHLFLSL